MMRGLVRAAHRHALALKETCERQHAGIGRATNDTRGGGRHALISVSHPHALERAPPRPDRPSFVLLLARIEAAPKLTHVSSGKRNRAAPTALNSADPIRNFSLSVDQRIRALAVGVPAWAARKRSIEDDEDRLVDKLLELHDKLRAKGEPPQAIDAAIVGAAEAFDLSRLNALIAKHNRYYPIEANLPMDRRSGGYLVYGRPWRPEEPYTAARLVSLVRDELDRRAQPDDEDR